jgi:hypothetical protein
MTVDYVAVLTALFPEAAWQIVNNDFATLTWDESNLQSNPTQSELDAAWPAIELSGKWSLVRAKRDRLLGLSDWTQVADAALTSEERQGWVAYRQALRDVPQTQTDPDSIVWPDKGGE